MLKKIFYIVSLTLLLSACQKPALPKHPENICVIFREFPSWKSDTKKTQKKWHVSPAIQLAIIYEESHFRSNAEPKRNKLLVYLPWLGPMSAYGYVQATDESWYLYRKDNHRISADRANFSDASDFIGWYLNEIHRKLHLPLDKTFYLYLAYHEGIDGYRFRTFRHNPTLIHIAHHVSAMANRYAKQLVRCR